MSFRQPVYYSSEWGGRSDSLTRTDSFVGSADGFSYHDKPRNRRPGNQDEYSAQPDGSHTFVDRNGNNRKINLNEVRSLGLSGPEERKLADRLIARVLGVREDHKERCREMPDAVRFDCADQQHITKNGGYVTVFFVGCSNVPTEVFEEMLAENEQLKQKRGSIINYPAIVSVVYFHSKQIKQTNETDLSDKPVTMQRVLAVTFLSPKRGDNFSEEYLDASVSKKAFSEHNKQAERNDPNKVFDSLEIEHRAKIDHMINEFYHNKDSTSNTNTERFKEIHKKLYAIVFRNVEDPEIQISSSNNAMLILRVQSKRNGEFVFDLFQSIIRLNKQYSGEIKIEFYIKPSKTHVYIREDNQLVKKHVESSVISITVAKMSSLPHRASNVSRITSTVSHSDSFAEQERLSRKKKSGDSDIYLGGGEDPRPEGSKRSRLDEDQ